MNLSALSKYSYSDYHNISLFYYRRLLLSNIKLNIISFKKYVIRFIKLFYNIGVSSIR